MLTPVRCMAPLPVIGLIQIAYACDQTVQSDTPREKHLHRIKCPERPPTPQLRDFSRSFTTMRHAASAIRTGAGASVQATRPRRE